MERWKLTAGLAVLALGGALVAQRLAPALWPADAPAPPPVAVDPTPGDPTPALAGPSLSDVQHVDLVLCLDTSSSMEQLLDSARARLWDVVMEVDRLAPEARLRVGLLTFGTPAAGSAETGHVVLRSPLTDDLDTLYADLFALTTHGGDEYVGWVLDDAVNRLTWTQEPDAARLVFVAGNESALQGPKDPLAVAEAAHARGFRINTLYAGDAATGAREAWDRVAEAGGGRYAAISMADGLVQVETPHDARIRELNEALNATYVPYGAEGEARRRQQLEQDARAADAGAGSFAKRVLVKGTSKYRNSAWDLVDAVEDGDVAVDELEEEALPAPLRELPPAARAGWVAEQKTRRDALERELAEVRRAREAWVDAHAEAGEGLGQKMREMVAEQL